MENCQEIQKQYQILSANAKLFRDAQKSGLKKERVTALKCKKNIEDAFEVLNELLGPRIFVKDAKNPFSEGYGQPEKETKRIDLEKQMNEDIDAYKECGLERWADDIEKAKGRLKHLSREKKKSIADELQEGAIMIFMPGKDVMFSLKVKELLHKLAPYWEREDVRHTFDSDISESGQFIALIEKRAKELVADVPERPYILLTKPTLRPEKRTTEKTVQNQKKELVIVNMERVKKGKTAQFDMKPHEYAAMQKFFVERGEMLGRNFTESAPLDYDTYTRFISLPLEVIPDLSDDSVVPCVSWRDLECGLFFHYDDANSADSDIGMRLSVRIEI
jgi:hypothetical protein